jgi:hypothetical protein
VPARVARWADAHAEIWNLLSRFCASNKLSLDRALLAFVKQYNDNSLAREFQLSAETRQLESLLAVRKLRRWFGIYKREGVAAVIPRFGQRRYTGVIETTVGMADFIVSMIAHTPHARATRVWEGLRVRFGDAIGDRALPSPRHVRRFIARWKREHRTVFERIENPERWRGHRSVALGQHHSDVTR